MQNTKKEKQGLTYTILFLSIIFIAFIRTFIPLMFTILFSNLVTTPPLQQLQPPRLLQISQNTKILFKAINLISD